MKTIKIIFTLLSVISLPNKTNAQEMPIYVIFTSQTLPETFRGKIEGIQKWTSSITESYLNSPTIRFIWQSAEKNYYFLFDFLDINFQKFKARGGRYHRDFHYYPMFKAPANYFVEKRIHLYDFDEILPRMEKEEVWDWIQLMVTEFDQIYFIDRTEIDDSGNYTVRGVKYVPTIE